MTNGLIRSALQLSKNVVVYTIGASDVAAKLQALTAGLEERVSYDNRPIARLHKELTASQVTIEFDGGDKATHGFLVHGPRNEMDLGFANKLNFKKTSPLRGELKVSRPFNKTTEAGCFAGGDCSSMGKILGASVAFGIFAATGAILQLQGSCRDCRLRDSLRVAGMGGRVRHKPPTQAFSQVVQDEHDM